MSLPQTNSIQARVPVYPSRDRLNAPRPPSPGVPAGAHPFQIRALPRQQLPQLTKGPRLAAVAESLPGDCRALSTNVRRPRLRGRE